MLFDAIFLGLFVGGWAAVGALPWLTLSVKTRGHAGLQYLPLCVFTAVVAGLAVPVVGLDDRNGIWISFISALVAPSLLLAVRPPRVRGLPAPQPGPWRKQPK